MTRNDNSSLKFQFRWAIKLDINVMATTTKCNNSFLTMVTEVFWKCKSRTQPTIQYKELLLYSFMLARSPILILKYKVLSYQRMDRNMHTQMYGCTDWSLYNIHLLRSLFKYSLEFEVTKNKQKYKHLLQCPYPCKELTSMADRSLV